MGRPFFNNKPRETNKKIIRTVEISYLIINFKSMFPLNDVFAIFEKSMIGIST